MLLNVFRKLDRTIVMGIFNTSFCFDSALRKVINEGNASIDYNSFLSMLSVVWLQWKCVCV